MMSFFYETGCAEKYQSDVKISDSAFSSLELNSSYATNASNEKLIGR